MFLSVVWFQTCRVEANGIKKQLVIIGIIAILIHVFLGWILSNGTISIKDSTG
jgi:hypothetical protein